MENLSTQLQNIGLRNHEASVYAVLIESSPASATFIAKKCSLSRSTVYTTLSGLISKGLVGTTYKNDVKQFIAEDYSSLQSLLKQEQANISLKLKALEKLQTVFVTPKKENAHAPHIVFFEGKEGLQKVYLSMMRDARPNTTLFLLRDEFVWRPDWKFIFEDEWHDRIKRWKKEKNIRTKLLVNASPKEKQHARFYTSKKGLSVRVLKKSHEISQFALYVIGDTVAILSMEHNNLVGIKIVNAHLARNFIATFDSLWSGAHRLKQSA